MKNERRNDRSPDMLEENLKKAVTEMLVMCLFSEQPRYIGELPELIERRSGGNLVIVFPYAAFYRIYKAGLITEEKKAHRAGPPPASILSDYRFRTGLSVRAAGNL